MAKRQGNPVRLIVAFSVAATLAVFMLYPSLDAVAAPEPAGRALRPGLPHRRVVGRLHGQADGSGLRVVRDVNGTATVAVRYRGSVPDLFRVGRDVNLRGQMSKGVFVAAPNSLVAKCPSRYGPKQQT